MTLARDLRFALRLFSRAPLPTGVALLSIALSVGASAVVFAAIQAVLIDPLPYAQPDRLVQLRSDYPGAQQQSNGDWVFWNDGQEILRRNPSFASVGIYRNALFDLSGDPGTPPEALYGLMVTADLFPTLGVAPMLGRNVLPGEDRFGGPCEMILSYGLWTRRFQADRAVVGHSVTVNGHACTVIGVMPAGFNFPLRREAAHTPSPYVEFWAPLQVRQPASQGALGAVARLRPEVTLAEARQDVSSISDALAREFPATNRDRVLHLNLLRDRAVGAAANGLWLLLAAALLFMLIGCANVANLLLARGLARRQEIAIRFALGAGRARLVRQMLTESCLLALIGGLAGYALAWSAWKILPAITPVSIPRLSAARAGAATLAFSATLAAINGALFGLAPALKLSGGRGAAAGRREPIRSALVVAEVALAVVLVVAGGQLLGSFLRLIAQDPGFQAGSVLASVVLPAPNRYPDPAKRALFYRRMLDAVRALPGVESAGTTDALPFSGENHGGLVNTNLTAEIDVIGGDYLGTMGVRLLAGRGFREEEMVEGSDTAIVSDLLADRLWPGQTAIGQRVCVFCTPENPGNWKRVVGVVSTARHSALDEPAIGNVYLAAGAMRQAQFLVVRTERPAGEMAKAIRQAIAAIDPDQPVFLSASLRTLIGDSLAGRRFIMTLLAIVAALALLLSAGGVYGVVSYTTSRRTQEIGIRMAVGARPGNIFSLIFREGFTTVAMGLLLGLGAALAAIRLLRGFLIGIESAPAAGIWIAAAVVTASAAVACWIPARRATVIDPISALRHD